MTLLAAMMTLPACMEGDFVGGNVISVQSVEGIWNGSGNFVGGGNLIALIEEGEFTIVQIIDGGTPVRFYFGEYTPGEIGTPRPGTITIYNGNGAVDQTNIPTTVTPSSTLNIQAGGETALLPLNPLTNFYQRASDLSFLDGNWGLITPGLLQLTLSINVGAFNGADSNGCNYEGSMSIVDPERNIYRVSDLDLTPLTAGACDRATGAGSTISFTGEGYEGYAAFFDANPASRQLLWMIVSNGERAFLHRFQRQ